MMSDKSLILAGNDSELATAETAAQAMAAVQARYAIAVKRPRNMDMTRTLLLKECDRPTFAEVAIWRRPVGNSEISGPSIRFIETAIRLMGNVLVESPVIYDDIDKRIVRVLVCDIESNATYSKDLTILKTVERRQLRGQQQLGERLNSYGKTVYTVRATDDEVAVKEAAAVSKAIRVLGQRLVPGDLVDEAIERIRITQQNRDAQDPDAARKRLVDAFAKLGIYADALVARLGHALEATTPQELAELREIHAALSSGTARWADFLEQPDDEPKKDKSSRTLEKLRKKDTEE
jgi:hypothetical protein